MRRSLPRAAAAPSSVRGARPATIPLLAVLLVLGACDGEPGRTPLEPEPPVAGPLLALVCTVDVGAARMSCAAPEAQLSEGAQGALTLGGQGVNVTLESSNECFEDDCTPAAPTGIFQADVTVQNLIGQALATTDGASGHAEGVRIFFHQAPVATIGSGTIEVENADGTAAFTNTNQPYFQYGGTVDDLLGEDDILSPDEVSTAKTWKWELSAGVESFEFGVYVWGEVQYQEGWIDVEPATKTLGLGAGGENAVTLTATIRDALGREAGGGAVTWSSSDEAVATVDESSGEVSAVGVGTATITATDGTVSGTAEITVAASLTDDTYPETVTGNVAINSANADGGAFSVVANDAFLEGDTISFAGWNGTAGASEQGGDVVMTTSDAGIGQFTYDPPAGYTGTDHFDYVIGEDTARVTLTVADMVWFVNNNAGACTTACDGRLSHPFTSLADFAAASDGAAGHPGNDAIVFVHESGTPYPGPFTLDPGQVLVGQDATASLATIAGITLSASSEPFPAMTPDAGTHTTIGGASGGIALGSNNTLRGLRVTVTGGTGISGNGFGTLTLGGDVLVAVQNGAALNLSNGAFSGAFRSVSADGGTNGIVLSNTTGTFEVAGAGSTASGGTIENMTGDGISLASTGAVELAWMTIQNNARHGIGGSTVAGFALRNSTVDSNGDAEDENGVDLTGLTGTAEITNSKITDSFDHNVRIANTGDILALTLSGDTITNTTTIVNGGDRNGVYLLPSGNATIDVTATGNAFSVVQGDNFRYEMAGDGGGHVEFGDNTIVGDGNAGIEIESVNNNPGSWSGTVTYDIFGNDISGVGGPIGLQAVGTTATAELSGYVRENTIGDGTAGSCGSTGIDIRLEGDGTHTAMVTGNMLDHCEFEGIGAFATAGSGDLNLTVQGNSVVDLGANPADSFELQLFGSGSTNSACLALGGTAASEKNTLDDGTAFSTIPVHIYLEQLSTTPLSLPGFSASGGGDLVADVDAYLGARNVAQGGGDLVLDPASALSNVQDNGPCDIPDFEP